MTSKGLKNETASLNMDRKLPRLPPIPTPPLNSSRFDNHPLLKYRRSEEVQSTLSNIIKDKARAAKYETEETIKKRRKTPSPPEMPSTMMSKDRKTRMNYQLLKQYVSAGPVTPMGQSCWEAILSLLPTHLTDNQAMKEHIEQLYDELVEDYKKSIQKSMVQCTLRKPDVRGFEEDEDLPDDIVGLDFSSPWQDSYLSAKNNIKRTLHLLHPSHQTILKICQGKQYSSLLLVDLSDLRSQGPVECDDLKKNVMLSCEKMEEKLMHSWYPEIVNVFVNKSTLKGLKRDQVDSFYSSVSTLLSNQIKEMILRTLYAYVDLFNEKDLSKLPLVKMELILDDEDNIQFYPMLDDLEDAVLSVVSSITGSLQKVTTIQSWLSGGPVSVYVDAKLDKEITDSCISYLKNAVNTYLVDPIDHRDSFNVNVDQPDEKAVLTYLSLLYKALPKYLPHSKMQEEEERASTLEEYCHRTKKLKDWISITIKNLNDREFPSSLYAMKDLMNQHIFLQIEVVPKRDRERRQLRLLLRDLMAMYDPRLKFLELAEGIHPRDVDEVTFAKSALEKSWMY